MLERPSQSSGSEERYALDDHQRFLDDIRKIASAMDSVGSTKWERVGTKISRKYYLLSRSADNFSWALHVEFSGGPEAWSANLRLQPFHLLRRHVLPVWLGTKDRKIGYDVNLTATSPEYGCADFTTQTHGDAEKCITVFRAAKDVALTIIDNNKTIANFSLPNDASFASIYEEISRP